MTIEFRGLIVQQVAIPLVPVGHPKYEWKTASDVQSTWRKYGWQPLSEQTEQPTQIRPAIKAVR